MTVGLHRGEAAKSDQFWKIGRDGLPSGGTNKNGLHRCSGDPNDAWFQISAQLVNFGVPRRPPKKVPKSPTLRGKKVPVNSSEGPEKNLARGFGSKISPKIIFKSFPAFPRCQNGRWKSAVLQWKWLQMASKMALWPSEWPQGPPNGLQGCYLLHNHLLELCESVCSILTKWNDAFSTLLDNVAVLLHWLWAHFWASFALIVPEIQSSYG